MKLLNMMQETEDFVMAKVSNIFEMYWDAQRNIAKNPDIYASVEYLKLLDVIKAYFDSLCWVGDDADRLIYLYSGKGLNCATVAGYMGMNENTYRSKASRISTKLSKVLFDGKKLSEVVINGDESVVRYYRVYIEQLNNRLVIGKELSSGILDKIHSVTVQRVQDVPVTEEDMFQALMLVALLSEPSVSTKLSQVNPAALKKVMDELFGEGVSEWCLYYKRMQSKLLNLQSPSQKVIDSCKNG